MAWTTPKTDWAYDSTQRVDTNYFNLPDYNRLVNNNKYLIDLMVELYNFDKTTTYYSTYKTLYYSSYLYASDMNKIIADIETMFIGMGITDFSQLDDTVAVSTPGFNILIIATPVENYFKRYSPQGNTMTWEELNEIESKQLLLYELLTNVKNNRPILPISL